MPPPYPTPVAVLLETVHDARVSVPVLATPPPFFPVAVVLDWMVHELSVSVPVIAAVKARVRSLSLADCKVTAQEALNAADSTEVRAIVARRHGDTR